VTWSRWQSKAQWVPKFVGWLKFVPFCVSIIDFETGTENCLLCDRERGWYGRIFRNLITLYVVHTKHGRERERERAGRPADLGITDLPASLLRANHDFGMSSSSIPATWQQLHALYLAVSQYRSQLLRVCAVACNNLLQCSQWRAILLCETQHQFRAGCISLAFKVVAIGAQNM
jgi:hypothetical protein